MRKRKVEVRSYRGKKTRERRWLTVAAVLLAVAFCAFTLYPGIRFTGILSLCLAGICLLGAALSRWADKDCRGAFCYRALLALLCAGTVVFGCIEGVLLSHGERDNSAIPSDAVLVLGAGVNGETPSLILRTRIDAAEVYLKRHPEVPAILSGGQGDVENISEAECMCRELVARGISEDRLWLEEESTSTAENFAFSRELLMELGIDPEKAVISVVTSDFHCFRAHLIAQREGFGSVLDIPAEAPWLLLNANYYVREAFALVKTLIFD